VILSQLQQFINRPKKYITIHCKFRYATFSMVSILLASSAILTEINSLSLNPIILLLLASIIYISVLFVQSIITDFFAQVFNYRANSYLLFIWFGISLLPLALNMPLNILSTRIPSLTILWGLCSLAILVSVLYLQIHIIKAIYGCSTKKSLLIYSLPYFAILGVVLLFIALISGLTLLFGLH
jgi:hypothetical protein